MSPEQYDRWKDFSLRMAKSVYAKHRRPDVKWITGVVEQFFREVEYDEDSIFTIIDWDHSGPYEDGRRKSQTSYCGCDGRRRENCGSPFPDCDECHGSGVHYDFQRGPYIGDNVSEMLWEHEPRPPRCKACEHDDCRRRYPHYQDKCKHCELECTCDEIEDRFREQWSEQWGGPVRCCIRAGLDVASAPSAGVCGFSAGDIRKMYPEGVPDWVKEFFQPGETVAMHPTNIAGIYVPEVTGFDSRSFDELLDRELVWL